MKSENSDPPPDHTCVQPPMNAARAGRRRWITAGPDGAGKSPSGPSGFAFKGPMGKGAEAILRESVPNSPAHRGGSRDDEAKVVMESERIPAENGKRARGTGVPDVRPLKPFSGDPFISGRFRGPDLRQRHAQKLQQHETTERSGRISRAVSSMELNGSASGYNAGKGAEPSNQSLPARNAERGKTCRQGGIHGRIPGRHGHRGTAPANFKLGLNLL